MKYESIKTTILIILVLSSIVLTWTLWTYQPQYEDLGGTADLVEEVTENNSEDTSRLIRPIKILYHMDGHHFGTYDETEINRVMKNVRTWEINELQNVTHTVQQQDFTAFLKQNGHVEIHFSDEIPLQIYKSFININDKEHSTVAFDRIIIDVNEEDRGEGIVYFVSTSEQLIYKGTVNSENTRNFKKSYYSIATRYPEQIEYPITESRSLFLPKENPSLNRYEYYYIDEIEVDTFIDRLFANSSLVKKDVLTTGEVHTDGTRLLSVYNNQRYIEFINPTRITGNQAMTTDLIQTSIDFVNEHVGWTDSYRFFSWDQERQTTVFKLYVNNIPIFNRNGLTEITQQWNNNEIVKYVHPSISLRISWDPKVTTIPSGEKVMETITSLPNFKPELLEYVTVAYELKEKLDEKQDNSQFVSLQPIWSYRYNGSWLKVETIDEEIGGNEDGLE